MKLLTKLQNPSLKSLVVIQALLVLILFMILLFGLYYYYRFGKIYSTFWQYPIINIVLLIVNYWNIKKKKSLG